MPNTLDSDTPEAHRLSVNEKQLETDIIAMASNEQADFLDLADVVERVWGDSPLMPNNTEYISAYIAWLGNRPALLAQFKMIVDRYVALAPTSLDLAESDACIAQAADIRRCLANVEASNKEARKIPPNPALAIAVAQNQFNATGRMHAALRRRHN
jgi:hypothetical protein